MDERTLLSALGGDRIPAKATAERHRDQLRHAIRVETRGMPMLVATATGAEQPESHAGAPAVHLDRQRPHSPGRPRRRPRLLLAAAAAVTLLLAAAVNQARPDGHRQTVTASEPPAGPAPEPAGRPRSEPRCGTDLPLTVAAPAGYDGPHPGPGGDVATAPEGDQHVLHWAAPTGTIEVRWPADPAERSIHGEAAPKSGSGTGEGVMVSLTTKETLTASGRVARHLVADSHPAAEGCDVMSVTISDADAARAGDATDHVYLHLFDGGQSQPLVVGSRPAEMAPKAGRCRVPAGIRQTPKRGSQVADGGGYPTPAAALEGFLGGPSAPRHDAELPSGKTHPQVSIATRGYEELTLPDGSVAYGYRPTPTGDFYATVIRVRPADAGWAVTAWESSGC